MPDSARQLFSHPVLVRISVVQPVMPDVHLRCDERIACSQFLTWRCHPPRSVPHRRRTRHASRLEMPDHRERSLKQRTNRKMESVSRWAALIHCLRKSLPQPSQSNGYTGVLPRAELRYHSGRKELDRCPKNETRLRSTNWKRSLGCAAFPCWHGGNDVACSPGR